MIYMQTQIDRQKYKQERRRERKRK